MAASCTEKKASLEAAFPDKFEGSRVELISFQDSIIMAIDTIRNGKVTFSAVESDSLRFPLLAHLNIDGRTRAYWVIEEGVATLAADSMSSALGTPLNDRLTGYFHQLDSVESLDDMNRYVDFAASVYNREKNTPLASYFGMEFIKFADASRVDSIMKDAPEDFRNCHRTAHYLKFARLRAATSKGKQYSDLAGEDAEGNPVRLSSFVKPGKYTLLDFMASWCPYCIKDFPRLKAFGEEYSSKGLEIVSIAVRDTPEDTRAAVARHGMTWPVIYNTGRAPYDIYGFSGIPHYILIGPDGKILERSESLPIVTTTLRSHMQD